MNALLLVTGLILALTGVCVSFTGIGAILGVPLALVGGSMFGLGFKRMFDTKAPATAAPAPSQGVEVDLEADPTAD